MEAKRIVDLAQTLIRFQNTNPERVNRCADYCADWLREAGLDTRVYEHRGLKSVVASVGSGSPTIVLNGHLDVVPAQPELFEPRLENGKLYGRGSYDMLGAVACMMLLMQDLAQTPPDCTVVLCLVPDEESGGELGTGFLVEQGWLGDIAICGEPTNLDIAIQSKGILQIVVEVAGIAAHGSRPWLGRNAILEAQEHYLTIASLHFFHEESPFLGKASLNLAKIEAGKAFNQVPDQCKMGIDIRYLPDQDPELLLEAIRKAVPSAEVKVHFQGTPVNTDPDNVWVSKLRKHSGTLFFGQEGSADTRFYAERGMPAVEFGPSGANHHGPGEYADVQSLCEYKSILKQFITHVKDEGHEV
ncbi:M20 family metallopeptidase [Cohnella suwonensis]|uniref:M20 family metallopeptidase n=1 Tax=Cohnella suwonensis TaxID=696072 RepID=A0ABW0LT79_9BACL